MYWRAEKYIVDLIVETTRRIIKYVPSFTNEDYEIIALSATGSTPETFEEYFTNQEVYPSLLVLGQGATYTNTALNNVVDMDLDRKLLLGTKSIAYYKLAGTGSVAFQLPSTFTSETVRGIECDVASVDNENQEDDIQISLIKNFLTAPLTVATGSIAGTMNDTFQRLFGNLDPAYTLDDNDYWVNMTTSDLGSYYIGLDSSVDYKYRTNSVESTGSISGSVFTPAIIRMGGLVTTNVSVKCSYKNSSGKARDLSEVLVNYFQLIKRAQISRAPDAIINTLLVFLNNDLIDEWVKRDVKVMNFRILPIEKRRRGLNDIIFTSTLTFSVISEWAEEYDAQTLEDISVTVNSVNRLSNA